MDAPDFKLPDENNTIHSLAEYKGTWIVLYFYPKDDTPGCTKEACGFRDTVKEIQLLGAEVIGISKDSPASHKKFKEKYNLPFTLLSDENKEVIKAYNSWGKKKFMGKEFEGTLRNTFLIDPDGKIYKTYEHVNPTQHAEEVIKDLTTKIAV
jgi:peroxiredoxin Q/BCP